MKTMNHSLAELCNKGLVAYEECANKSSNIEELSKLVMNK